MAESTVTLNNGKTIPALGFGTYKIPNDDAKAAVLGALDVGYRHIDTAQMYNNERGVGDALAASSVPREDIFLTTKLNNGNHLPDDVRRSFAESLDALQTDYVDLFLIHWPLPSRYDGDFITTYKVMEELYESGQARSIGVSNFEIHHLEKLMGGTSVKPAVDQIELHPAFSNADLAAFCQDQGIAVESWSPLGRGTTLQNPAIIEIADRIGATPAQVALAWHRQKGYIAIPKSVTPARQQENFDSLKVELDPSDMSAIDALHVGESGRTGQHPDKYNKI